MLLDKQRTAFSFEKFIAGFKNVFQVLEKYQEPMYESENLRLLFDRCQNAYSEFKQGVVVVGAAVTISFMPLYI